MSVTYGHLWPSAEIYCKLVLDILFKKIIKSQVLSSVRTLIASLQSKAYSMMSRINHVNSRKFKVTPLFVHNRKETKERQRLIILIS